MKKVFGVLMMLALAFNIQAQNGNAVSKAANAAEVLALDSASTLELGNAERLVDKYSTKIADTFTKGLETVVPVATDGFNMVVKYEIAKGVAFLSPFFFCIILIIVTRFLYAAATKDSQDIDDTFVGIMCIITFILTCVAFIVGVVLFSDAIMHLIAPEWYAIKDIIDLFK